ncbi:phosphatidate cytidylyltransferase [Candidatus Collinsella stercoripullorum]|uniref:phosphatidate cytidylyltransferase n=1 Tax=Candidatus Collinsella stercoripullorum TaxID=2838522 RepID=UPI0022E148CD|nr:phosphatidate cytidylyltransferase [Candidatus Collinsella stercoripullorum]
MKQTTTSSDDEGARRPADGAKPAPERSGALHGLIVRAGFGLIYVGLFIACLLLGTLPTALFCAAMSWLCCFEFFRMMRLDGKVPNELLGLAASVLFPLSALVDAVWLTGLMFVLVLSLGLWYVFSPRARIADVAVTGFGPLYTGYMLSSIVLLRDAVPGAAGALLAIGVCASLWVSDSFAYLVGSRLGRHKMVPKISPNKSWEGFAGGIVGSVAVWLILEATGWYAFDVPFAVLCGVAVGVLGVFGDLIESRIKRGVGVKDSGNLIPGHGGMLDRSDSLIFGCITAYLILRIGGIV